MQAFQGAATSVMSSQEADFAPVPAGMPAAGPLPFLCVDMPAAFQGAVPAGTLAGPQPAQGVCTVTESGKVHLANVFEISKEAYDTLMALQKDSLIVKRAATTLWSTEVLAQRSCTGTLSYRFRAEGGDKAPQ